MQALLCHLGRSQLAKGPASTTLLEEIGGVVNERPNKFMLYEILLLHGLPGESYHPSIVLRRSHNVRSQIALECTLLICAILSGVYGQILLDARCTTLRNMHFQFGASTPNQGIEGTLHEIHRTAYQAMALEATSRSQDPTITDESLLPPMTSPTIGLPKHRVLLSTP